MKLKYRIKIEQTHRNYHFYTPQVKRGLFSKWYNIIKEQSEWGHYNFMFSDIQYNSFARIEHAMELIEGFKKNIFEKQQRLNQKKVTYKYI